MARHALVVEVGPRRVPSLVLARTTLEACCLLVPREGGEEPATVPCVLHAGRWCVLRGITLEDLLDAVEGEAQGVHLPVTPLLLPAGAHPMTQAGRDSITGMTTGGSVEGMLLGPWDGES